MSERLPLLKRDWFLSLILMLAAILTYLPVWHAGFIWDDDQVLAANPVIVGPLGLREIWTTSAADICPLTLTTFWVEHALWGLDALPYHLVNVFMHAVCAVLLWRVLRNLRVPGAWMGAALWALHPVQVESVAWIAEMKNTESGLFFLLSIFFFVKWLREKEKVEGKKKSVRISPFPFSRYPLTLLFAALAMASKSSTVILPVALCLCAWWIEGRWQWRNLARTLPVFLMSIAAAVVSMWTQRPQGAADLQWVQSWPQRLVTAGDAVWFYAGKLAWPHPLIAVYPRWQIDAGCATSYLPLLAVIIVTVFLWLKRESWLRPCFFAWTYFLVALLPTLGLITMSFSSHSFVADHLQYLASMGTLALFGAGLARLADNLIPAKTSLRPSLCAALLLVLGLLSWHRARAYENEEALWTDTLAKNPDSWVGHYNLGEVLVQKGQVDAAIAEWQKTLELNPMYANARYNLGLAFFQKGQVDEAIAQFQKAIEINPVYLDACNNLGVALVQKGRIDDAIAEYQKAIDINPGDAKVHYNLGAALMKKGQVDDAIAQFQWALRLNPDLSEAQNDLLRAQAMKPQR